MILYDQGVRYWNTVKAFHANRQLPGMALHSVEALRSQLPGTASPAVRRRIDAFITRHSKRPTPPSPPLRTA